MRVKYASGNTFGVFEGTEELDAQYTHGLLGMEGWSGGGGEY